MLNMIINLVYFLLIIYTYVFYIRKREPIVFEIRNGIRCFNCKERLPITEQETINAISKALSQTSEKMLHDNDFKLCKKCERDYNITLVMNKRINFQKIVYKTKRLFVSHKMDRILKISIFILMGAIIVSIVSMVLKWETKMLLPITNLIFWTVLLLKLKFTTIKKSRK